MNKYRIEEDCLGQVQVEADKYWKSQTQRSIENFKIGYETMPESMIVSFAILKSACAKQTCISTRLLRSNASTS